MYMFETMIELTKTEWKSALHKQWAVAVCIGNPAIRTLDEMKANVNRIQELTDDEIKTATVGTMVRIGCTF